MKPPKEEPAVGSGGHPFKREGEKDAADNAPPPPASQTWTERRDNPARVTRWDSFACILCGVHFYRKRPSDQFCPQHDEWEGAILIGGHTGLRFGDVLSLTARNVHDGRLVVKTGKTGAFETRVVVVKGRSKGRRLINRESLDRWIWGQAGRQPEPEQLQQTKEGA